VEEEGNDYLLIEIGGVRQVDNYVRPAIASSNPWPAHSRAMLGRADLRH
jgi:hypothetical protein